MSAQFVIIGIVAGLVSALLFASAATGTFLGLFVLFFLSPLPVAIAGLGWGWRAAAVATATGTGALAIFTPVRAEIMYAVALGAPTAFLTYLALLNRDFVAADGKAATEWYPIGRIVAAAAFVAGALGALALITTAPDLDALREHIGKLLERMMKRPPGVAAPPGMPENLTPEQLAGLTNLVTGFFAPSLATTWLGIALLNLWIAGRVVRFSDRLVRPWPAIAELQMPRTLPIALAVALAATFLAGYPGLLAAGFACSLLVAYTLVGLAIIHTVTRGLTQRPAILAFAYAALIMFGVLAAPLIAMIGLAEPFSPLRRKPPGASTT